MVYNQELVRAKQAVNSYFNSFRERRGYKSSRNWYSYGAPDLIIILQLPELFVGFSICLVSTLSLRLVCVIVDLVQRPSTGKSSARLYRRHPIPNAE